MKKAAAHEATVAQVAVQVVGHVHFFLFFWAGGLNKTTKHDPADD